MPGEMWDAAIGLANVFGVWQIARAVGLHHGWLRKKVEKVDVKKASSASSVLPAFLEVPLGMVVATAEAQPRNPMLI